MLYVKQFSPLILVYLTGFQSRSPKVILPVVIFLEVPNTLVLEVEGTGSYESIEWSKTGETICPLNEPSDGYKLAFFDQVLYHSDTTEADYGHYRAEYSGLTDGVNFLVLSPGETKNKP